VRLAQRIPIYIHIDETQPDVVLSAGMTATVEIDSRGRARDSAVSSSAELIQ
jgi:multidrug resistance efflux pump